MSDSQQPVSPILFLFLKLPPPPRAALLVKQSNLAKHANVMMILADYEDRASISILQACALWETLLRNLDECFRVSVFEYVLEFNGVPALWCPKQL